MSSNRGIHNTSVYTETEVYEYIRPGIYMYPVLPITVPTVAQPCFYLQNYPYVQWSIQPINAATYVVSPTGVVNYMSDLQSHMALPYGDILNSGLIYQVMENNVDDQHNSHVMNGNTSVYLPHEVTDYQMPNNESVLSNNLQNNYAEADMIMQQNELNANILDEHEENDENDLDVSPPKRARLMFEHAKSHHCGNSNKFPETKLTENVEIEEAIPKKRPPKNIYRTNHGYLVEEPNDAETEGVSCHSIS